MPRKRTRFEDLELLAAEMTPDEVWDALRQLARDDRFAAVVAWLKRSEQAWTVPVVAGENAANHGTLASAAGSLGALVRLQSQLRDKLRKTRDPASPTPAD